MSSGNAKIGYPAPNFKATAVMPDGQFKDISLSEYKGKIKEATSHVFRLK
jgi:peroxiredoxin 1